MYKEFTPLF